MDQFRSAQTPPITQWTPVPIIGVEYCASADPLQLVMVKEILHISNGNFEVKDSVDNVVFKVKGKIATLRDRRVLYDAAGNPIVTIRRKIPSLHERWEVFKGESAKSRDLIFSVKRSAMVQSETNLLVFLANNNEENFCDYKVKVGSEQSCQIYIRDSSTEVAKMRQKETTGSIFLDRNKYIVTVNPNMDCAFIVSLIVLLDDINE
ncbi:protein LURP-one-related 15-like [Fagus crenata]